MPSWCLLIPYGGGVRQETSGRKKTAGPGPLSSPHVPALPLRSLPDGFAHSRRSPRGRGCAGAPARRADEVECRVVGPFARPCRLLCLCKTNCESWLGFAAGKAEADGARGRCPGQGLGPDPPGSRPSPSWPVGIPVPIEGDLFCHLALADETKPCLLVRCTEDTEVLSVSAEVQCG